MASILFLCDIGKACVKDKLETTTNLSFPANSTSLLKATATDLPREKSKKATPIERIVNEVLTFFLPSPALIIVKYFIFNFPLMHQQLLISRLDEQGKQQP